MLQSYTLVLMHNYRAIELKKACQTDFCTFCLVATEPYIWTETDLYVLATLAQVVSSEIALRAARDTLARLSHTLEEGQDRERGR